MANPTAQEQELLELINRMRMRPDGELEILLNSGDPDVAAALKYFNVNLDTLKSQWSKLKAVAPLAWSSPLNDAAKITVKRWLQQTVKATNYQEKQI